MNTIRKEELSTFRAAVYERWKRRLDTCDIARELNVSEALVERELHRIMDARFAVNTVLGAG